MRDAPKEGGSTPAFREDNMIRRRDFHRGFLGGVGATSLGFGNSIRAAGAATAFPDRVITLVVPFAAGGATDLAGRLLAEKLGPNLVQGGRAIVDNRPGAGSALGADFVRRARPDGYTLLVGSASTLGCAPASGAQAARYHPTEDFTPITLFGVSTMGVVVAHDSGITTLGQLVAKLKAEPGKHGYATSGVGGISHLASAAFALAAGVEVIHVPYRGGAQTAEAILKGDTLFAIDTLGSNVNQIRDGALRLLAVTTTRRDPNFPDVPTLAESGLTGYDMSSWTVLVGPAGLPETVTNALSRASNQALSDPTVRERLDSTGTIPDATSTPASTRDFIDKQFAILQEVCKRIGLQVD